MVDTRADIKQQLETCPSGHVWPASQHSLEWDATIIKNNNVIIVFFSETTFSLVLSPTQKLGESSLNLYYQFWDEKEWLRSCSSVITQLYCIITHSKNSE